MNQKKTIFTALSLTLFLGLVFLYSQQLEERTRMADLVREHQSQQALKEQIYQTKGSQAEQTKPSETFSVSMDWLEITKANYWNRPELFARGELRSFPSIKLSYPSNWRFDCCSDMDHASANNFIPLDSGGRQIQGGPFVSILTHGLRGCSNLTESCSLNDKVILTPKEKLENLINTIPENASVLPEKTLSGINKKAFAYTYSRSRETSSTIYESYLVSIGGDIIEIQFKDPEKLGAEFIETFLQEIRFDTNPSAALPSVNRSSSRKLSFCNTEYQVNKLYAGTTDIIQKIAEFSNQQRNQDFCNNFSRNKSGDLLDFEIYRRPMDIDYSPDEYYVRSASSIWTIKDGNIYLLGGFDGSLEFYGTAK